MTSRTPVLPLINFCSSASLMQYERGMQQRMNEMHLNHEDFHGPLPDHYFVENLKGSVARNEFGTPLYDRHIQATMCFWLGMIHGGVLSPDAGLLRPDMHTLVIIRHPEFARGYNVGRRWYFFDAMPDEERVYTDVRVVQEMRELVAEESEEFAEGADDKCIQYCVGTLLGALSAQLFPMTEEEHREWEAELQYWLARSQQERVTEPLVQRVPQHI